MFRDYVKNLCTTVFVSTLVLGIILGIALLFIGETSMGLDVTFDFGTFDGIWLMLVLPILATLIFAILSPLSYLVSHLAAKQRRSVTATRDE